MRLICPNCGAQYDVDDDAIPLEGRDVQCSDCGHTWFESPDDPSAEAEGDMIVTPPPPPPPAAPVAPVAPPVAAAPVAEPQRATPPPAAPATPRQQLDPSIADILREEAAREEAVRKAEARGSLEHQDELALPTPDRSRPAASATPRSAQPQPSAPVADTAPSARSAAPPVPQTRVQAEPPSGTQTATQTGTQTGTRREMFPDIEEINSTLRSSADRAALPLTSAATAERERRSGRHGFVSTLIAFGILALIYAYADTIGTAMPVLATPLDGYVNSVDAGRLRLDTWVQGLLGDVPPAS